MAGSFHDESCKVYLHDIDTVVPYDFSPLQIRIICKLSFEYKITNLIVKNRSHSLCSYQ